MQKETILSKVITICIFLLKIGGKGLLGIKNTRSVWKFDSNNLNNPHYDMPSMVYERSGAACTVYNSSLHGGRPVLIVVGSDSIAYPEWNSLSRKAEILDYTVAGASWQESNFTFQLFVSLLFNMA